MKILGKIVGGILIFLVLLLVVLRVVGLEPRDNRPGFWLKGNLVTIPVTDWSFSDKYPTIMLQTRTWYLLPHSVTITCVSYHGQLYLTSGYGKGVQYPNGRSWHRDIVRDPYVRLKIGDQLYDAVISYVVTDPAEKDPVLDAKAKKYPPYGNYQNPTRKPAPGSTVVLLKVTSS